MVISHNAGGYSFYKSIEHHLITWFSSNEAPLGCQVFMFTCVMMTAVSFGQSSDNQLGRIKKKPNIHADMDYPIQISI